MLESNMSLEEIATYISDDLNTRVVEETIPKYECDCSKDRMERALLSIGKKDLAEIAQEGKAELVCHFCNKKYELVVKEKDGEFIVE